MNNDDRAKLEALPAFDDPHVQIVYRILCDTDLVPPPDEHWEGFTARHVVAALASAQAASAEPVAPTIHAVFETDDGGCIGTTSAPVKRVERHDDGAFTVVIDHWPAPAVAPAAVTDEPEAIRMAYKTGYEEGYEDGSGGAADHDACEEGWQQYLAALANRTQEPQAETQEDGPWIGCRSCDVSFHCHNGKAACMRLPQDERTVEVHMDYEHGGLAFGPRPDSRGQAQEGWKRAIDWLRNNYQDHRTVGDLCDAMLAASPTPDEQRAQAAQEDGPTEEQRILKRAVESVRLFHRPRDEALVLMGLARHAAAVDAAHTRGNATDDQLRDAWVTLKDALRTALAGRQQL